jgi:hypothetical protein
VPISTPAGVTVAAVATAIGAELVQRVRHEADHLLRVDADQPSLQPCRVQQRPQDVEDRAHAQRLAHGHHVLHRRVEGGREHEGDAGLAKAALDAGC